MSYMSCEERLQDTKRKNERRKNQVRMYFLCEVFILVMMSFIAGRTTLITKAEIQEVKIMKPYKVEKGDTLYGISKKFMDSHYNSTKDFLQEVMQINNLHDDVIIENQTLYIPIYIESEENYEKRNGSRNKGIWNIRK